MDLPAPLTGPSLRAALTAQTHERPPLIEGLLYEKTSVLISSDAGVGKSTILTQLVAQASISRPIFGLFPVVRPLSVYYLMSERDVWEPLDRLKRLEAVIPFQDRNIIIDAECVGLNLAKSHHFDLIVHRILAHHPDVIAVDPIYGFFEGGMGGDEVAIRVGRFATALLRRSSKSVGVLLWHHNVKNTLQPNSSGKLMEKDSPFYGSQFLKAHVTGYYDLSRTKQGTLWKRKKDTYGVLHPDFTLIYDPITGLSQTTLEPAKLDKRDQLRLYLQQRSQTAGTFLAQDILAAVPMTDRYLRGLLKDPEILPLYKVVSINENVTLYEAVKASS